MVLLSALAAILLLCRAANCCSSVQSSTVDCLQKGEGPGTAAPSFLPPREAQDTGQPCGQGGGDACCRCDDEDRVGGRGHRPPRRRRRRKRMYHLSAALFSKWLAVTILRVNPSGRHTVVPPLTNLICFGTAFVQRKVCKSKYHFPLKCMGTDLIRSSISKNY